MIEEDSRIELLTTDLDEALSSIEGLQERVRILEETVRADRAEFLNFRTWAERTLGNEGRTRERRARKTPDSEILSVEVDTVRSEPRTPLTSSPHTGQKSVTTPRHECDSLVRIVGGKKPAQYQGKTYRVLRHSGANFCIVVNANEPDEPSLKRAHASLVCAKWDNSEYSE